MATKRPSNRLLTTDQVADRLLVTTKTVRRWIAAGDLHAIKLKREWRVRESELERILDAGRLAA